MTRSSALHLLVGELGEPAGAGQGRVGDEDVDARGRGGEALGLTVLGEVGDDDPVVRSRAGDSASSSRSSSRRPLRTSGGAGVGEALGDRPTEAAGRPGEKCCAPGYLHSKAPIY